MLQSDFVASDRLGEILDLELDISAVTNSGFVIEKLLEPMPTEQFKNKRPDTYDILTKRPQFLFIRAKKLSI